MSSTTRALAAPLRSFVAAARPARNFATLPSKNPTPSGPIEPSRTQAHPIGAFYEAILNTPQLLPETKPEGPASSVKHEASSSDSGSNNTKEPAANEPPETTPATKRGRKAKPVDSANTAASNTSVSTSSDLSSSSSASPGANTTFAEPSTQEKAKVIFGSTLAGPAERAERLAQIRSKSAVIAGVVVPPKPEEPDNCCMSGCVNCVWERFRDEMETWATANAEAERRVAAVKNTEAPDEQQRARRQGVPVIDHPTISMDDDGGGSDTNWDVVAAPAAVPVPAAEKLAKDFWDDELYKNVPVGIREFMKQEKRLKEKHLREETAGGNDG